MAISKPTLPKGTRDFGPADVQKRKYILNTIETVFKKYGFMPLETPTMENLSTLEGKYGDEGDKLLFRVLNSGNPIADLTREDFRSILKQIINDSENKKIRSTEIKDKVAHYKSEISELVQDYKITKNQESINKVVAISDDITKSVVESEKARLYGEFSKAIKKTTEKGLRYDLTVPFARYVVMNRNEITFPFKRYQMQPVWRADRPQKGRYREFWQCDADMVGSDSLLNELDLIQVYDEAFRNLGIANYELRVNNRKILAGIAEVVKSIDHMSTIAIAIDKLDKIGVDGVRKELTEQGFSEAELDKLFAIISIKGDSLAILNELKPKLAGSAEGLKGIEELEFIFNALKQLSSSPTQPINLKTDFSLARGLSYYTGCIFEVVSTEGTLTSSIGGGGRYDNLTGIFGLPNVSGVGISFGLDRIFDVMDELKLFPEALRSTTTKVLFCHADEATQLYCLPALKQLRDAGIAAELYPDVTKKMGKQVEYATALQIPFAAIAEQTEMEQGLFKVRNLVTREQKNCTVHELIELVR